jgi:hypothetical protein
VLCLQAAGASVLGPPISKEGGQPEQQPSHHPQQVLVLEIQDRFGCLFLDFRGTSRACFMFGAVKQVAMALRGVLLGVFVGGWLVHPAPSLA